MSFNFNFKYNSYFKVKCMIGVIRPLFSLTYLYGIGNRRQEIIAVGYGEQGYGDSDHDGYTKERDGDIQKCFGD